MKGISINGWTDLHQNSTDWWLWLQMKNNGLGLFSRKRTVLLTQEKKTSTLLHSVCSGWILIPKMCLRFSGKSENGGLLWMDLRLLNLSIFCLLCRQCINIICGKSINSTSKYYFKHKIKQSNSLRLQIIRTRLTNEPNRSNLLVNCIYTTNVTRPLFHQDTHICVWTARKVLTSHVCGPTQHTHCCLAVACRVYSPWSEQCVISYADVSIFSAVAVAVTVAAHTKNVQRLSAVVCVCSALFDHTPPSIWNTEITYCCSHSVGILSVVIEWVVRLCSFILCNRVQFNYQWLHMPKLDYVGKVTFMQCIVDKQTVSVQRRFWKSMCKFRENCTFSRCCRSLKL